MAKVINLSISICTPKVTKENRFFSFFMESAEWLQRRIGHNCDREVLSVLSVHGSAENFGSSLAPSSRIYLYYEPFHFMLCIRCCHETSLCLAFLHNQLFEQMDGTYPSDLSVFPSTLQWIVGRQTHLWHWTDT